MFHFVRIYFLLFFFVAFSTIFAFGRKKGRKKGRKMDTLKIKLVFDRKGIANTSNKQGVIEVYIYDSLSRKKIYISTGIEVLKNQFTQPKGERGRIVKHPNIIVKNGQLERTFREIEAFALSDKCKSIEDIKNRNVKKENTQSVISFMEAELVRKNPAYETVTQHKTLIKRLQQFGKIKIFKDLTYENIIAFDDFLKSEGDEREALSDATAYKRHSILKGYIKEAVNRGYCTYNPYGTFTPKKGKSKDPVFLTEEELLAIKNYNLADKVDGDRLIKVRDLFVFQCFTGLAYVDLKAFKGKEEISEIDGQKVIRSNRQKTEQGYITVLLPDSIDILERYDYKLPIISNQKYNDYLKLLQLYIVDKSGKPIITKKLTTHVARHSWATTLLRNGVSTAYISKGFGHASFATTEQYLGGFTQDQKKDVADIFTKLANV